MILICTFIEPHAVRPGSGSQGSTARLLLGIEMKTAHQVIGLVVEVGKAIRKRLLKRSWKTSYQLSS